MKKEISCLIKMIVLVAAFGLFIDTVNSAVAASKPVVTVGEELGLTLADFQFDDESVVESIESNDQSVDYVPVAVDYDPIPVIHAMTCMCCETEDCSHDLEFLDLIYRAVEAEAGNQGFKGKQLVADVILNRIDSPRFPNNLHDVIYQENAFSIVADGRINTVTISEETIEAVQAELKGRLDYDIVFFSAGGYNKYCEPAYPWRDHYFGY